MSRYDRSEVDKFGFGNVSSVFLAWSKHKSLPETREAVYSWIVN
mgnify:CR=1 FL=1